MSAISPCVRNCCLNDDLVCVGCFRSLDEVKEWSIADDGRRQLIVANAVKRAAAYRETARPTLATASRFS